MKSRVLWHIFQTITHILEFLLPLLKGKGGGMSFSRTGPDGFSCVSIKDESLFCNFLV